MPFAVRSLIAAGALALAAAAPLAAPLAAQARADSVTLPRELLESLLGIGMRPAEVVVGRLPEGFPATLAAAPTEVLGGTRLAPGAGIAVLRLEAAPDSAVSLLTARLRADGWAAPAPRGAPSRGFVSPAGRPGRALTLCRGDEALHLNPSPRAAGSLVHVSRVAASNCRAEPTFYRPDERYVDFQIPALLPPANARMSFGGSGGSGGSDDHQHLSTRLETDLSADSLAGHYAAQLEQAGWRRTGEARTGEARTADLAARTLTHRDPQGRALHAVLTVVAVPGDPPRDVELRVRRVRR